MSSIIDDLIFYRQGSRKAAALGAASSCRDMEQLIKNFAISHNPQLVDPNPQKYQTLAKVKIKNHEYSIRLKADADRRLVKVEARLLEAQHFKRINSKHNEILFLKQVFKSQSQAKSEQPYCLVKGCVVMLQKIYFWQFGPIPKKKITEFYNRAFIQNFRQFEDFINQTNLVTSQLPECPTAAQEDLLLAQNLCTSLINFDVCQEKSKYQQIEEAIKRQQSQIRRVVNSIRQADAFQGITNSLFVRLAPRVQAKSVADNLQARFEKNFSVFSKALGGAKILEDKKIDDFLFNTVKINFKQQSKQPIGQGGSCQIFLARAEMTFIDSFEYMSYFKNDEKKQKVIALKKLKPEYQKMVMNKLDHEKMIVSKLKGGVCCFIPKYYESPQTQGRGDTLLMEYVQGDQLDIFMAGRQQTISLQTKLRILLNVVHGMRHISSYEITHLDLKPINIMVSKTSILIPKIIDFGEAHHPKVCDQNYSPGYTFPYVAPEVFIKYGRKGKEDEFQFSQKQDVFAFGCILFQVVFSQKIFHCSNHVLQQLYARREFLERFSIAYERLEAYGDYLAVSSLTNLIIRCLDPKPERRPSFDWIGIILHIILNSGAAAL